MSGTSDNERDSPYTRQIEKGFRLLAFEPSLEAEFREHYLTSIHARVVLCLLGGISFSLWAVFASRSAGLGSPDPDLIVALRTWVIRPLSLALIAVAVVPALFRRYWLGIAPVTLAITGAISAYSSATAVAGGNPSSFVVMLTGLLAVLLLLGFLFWHTLALGAVIAGSYIVFLANEGVATSAMSFETTVLTAMVVLILIFAYNLEKSLRTNFIQTRILEDIGRLDALTALKNRRSFDEGLLMLWRQAVRDDKKLAMLLIDVDFFKDYNDRYGHQAGDLCLKRIADVLARAEQRPLDMAARIGGEEFALICYGTSTDHARALGDRILKDVRELRIPHFASRIGEHVTVSIGAVIVQPIVGRNPESFFQYADEALYEAKSTGRDRMVLQDDGYSAVVTGEFKAGVRLKGI